MKKLVALLVAATLALVAAVPSAAATAREAAVASLATPAGTSAGTAAATATPVPAPPSRASVIAAARSAVDHFYIAGGGATSNAGWRWTPYFMAVETLHRQTGDPKYRQWLQSWGDRNRWTPDAPVSPTSNPDSRAAIQVWQDSVASGVTADLAPSDRFMAADRALPASQYWWVDSMFMGLPLWPRWAARTGDPAYRARSAEFYAFLKRDGTTVWRPGCTASGLFDATEDLWWRDCKFVAQRDALGHKVFWARGNGWVIAAMARTLMALPSGDPQAAEYRSMLQRMAARLARLQGADGMWRSSLLSPSLYPAPETSATALFTYAMAYGIRTGVLDAGTYLPVVLNAWKGLTTTSLKSTGFVSHCQGVGDAPAAPSLTTSIAYCVGAFGLAASEVAQLEGYLAADTFSRTVSGGLGTADVGGPWTTTAVAADLAVDGRTGTLRTPAATTRSAVLAGVQARDTDVRATVGFLRPTRGSVHVALLGRRVGTAEYAGRAVVDPAGAVQVQALRSGTTLRALTLPGLTYASGDRLVVRVQVTGASPTTVRVRVWKAGAPEPTTWQVTSTDSTAGLQTAGSVGITTYLGSGALPASVVVTVDDVVVRRAG
ncbi:glycoside hydrolase family 88 protein [Cellulomonas aerilata]|uniref:Glycosyl hydrolase family 88 n=1 Tax=Cellulomonas aerilata TaxID=515326 RepID=A0A512DHT2_9CELL|nr:glycoside hydrolase family 88 protein [Cellulomonas aerilata]GEO35770.1 hypothetical protein CAE01nite_34950 [Cellulomonas aerilata]